MLRTLRPNSRCTYCGRLPRRCLRGKTFDVITHRSRHFRDANRRPPRPVPSVTRSVTEDTVRVAWSNPLRYFFSFALPSANLVALYSDVIAPAVLQGYGAVVLQRCLAFSGLILPFVILPILDFIFGRDTVDPPSDLALDGWYRVPLYLYVPLHVLMLFCCCRRASILLMQPSQFVAVLLGVGVCGGLGFTVAHELIHSAGKFEAFLRDVLLCLFCYMHYASSHIAHHLKVGTRDDAGTGRLKETVYAFLPRAMYMSVRDGLWMEKKRLKAQRRNLLSLDNRMWKWFSAPIACFSSVYLYFGAAALKFMCIQAAVAIVTLEVVNYLEHYGLTRTTINGKLEPVSAKHSWNADWGWTSALIFELQRHAHHHLQSSMPYQALKSLPEAPLMPMSYPGMMMVALVPPLFFRLVHPRLQKLHSVH